MFTKSPSIVVSSIQFGTLQAQYDFNIIFQLSNHIEVPNVFSPFPF
jgi:hypothetical protein